LPRSRGLPACAPPTSPFSACTSGSAPSGHSAQRSCKLVVIPPQRALVGHEVLLKVCDAVGCDDDLHLVETLLPHDVTAMWKHSRRRLLDCDASPDTPQHRIARGRGMQNSTTMGVPPGEERCLGSPIRNHPPETLPMNAKLEMGMGSMPPGINITAAGRRGFFSRRRGSIDRGADCGTSSRRVQAGPRG